MQDQCLQAVARELRALKLGGLKDSQIEVRDSWYIDDVPLEGLTISKVPETMTREVVGMQDIGYGCAVTFVRNRSRDAKYKMDPLALYREATRRRFFDRRIPLDVDDPGPRRSICTVTHGRPDIPRGMAADQYEVEQLIVWFWFRENPDPGE